MIRGYFEKISEATEIKAGAASLYTLIFVLGGELEYNCNRLCVGEGMFCAEKFEVSINEGEFLKIEFDSQPMLLLLAGAGINSENEVFEFSDIELLQNIAKCFFENEKRYDNAMMESGIANIVLSGVKKNEDTVSARDYIERAEAYIEANLSRHIKVEQIADELKISRGYLRNLFYKSRGTSPQEYLMKKRMDKAKELLSSRNLPVASVAASVGYDDALGFSRMFKRYCGVSPSEYRRDNAMDTSDNAIKTPPAPVRLEKPIKSVAATVHEPVKAETIDDIAAQIEKAAAAAKAEREKKEGESAPPPFWLL